MFLFVLAAQGLASIRRDKTDNSPLIFFAVALKVTTLKRDTEMLSRSDDISDWQTTAV